MIAAEEARTITARQLEMMKAGSMEKKEFFVFNDTDAMKILEEIQEKRPEARWTSGEKPTEFLPDEDSFPVLITLSCDGRILYRKAGLLVKPAPDPVNHPSHYTDGQIEVIDYIEDKKLGYHLGNAVKYISRAGKKDPEKEVEDLQKAVWYINRKIQKLQQAKAARRQALEDTI